MCWRQWVIFHCGDLRYVEFRCDQNPSNRPFESCDTRQTTAISRAATCAISHPDPDLLSFPGRCVDWGRIPGNTFGNAENVIFNTFTWIVCSKEWHTANSEFFNNSAPNPCINDASSNSKTGTSEGLQKKLKVGARYPEDIITKTSDIVDSDSLP
ncbi:hypothetical protein BCIN_03g02690 [Botrytis cinerea B05.10]|uniref:Uncharacterized protein n=1 Tax=Botryotinia fuckeliana (strain B05.10) TaxID=332648 RepID=A0A384JC09_BOTFB|nr:hypothetical protein BCIN_03g02690 [Botrytis cinerea B05.10]ATZ48002.1 hypothetical protein BCIN_03g02690 [Botrytis cinerea B05.10]